LTIPVLLISGWYGMNFTRMPELGGRLGYIGVTAFTLVSTVAIILFMKRRKWL